MRQPQRDRLGSGSGSPDANETGGRVGALPLDIKYDERGLVPAIVQDAATGAVLMLGYMDREALAETERTREVHFHSRSRDALWRKGETSGHVLHVVSVDPDCDGDTLLVKAHAAGPVCHTGSATCFAPGNDESLGRFLSELVALLRQRRRDLPVGSHSAELFRGGRRAIARKLVEEAVESALAAELETRERALSEFTDLVYAALVLATDLELTPEEVRASLLAKRAAATARREEDRAAQRP